MSSQGDHLSGNLEVLRNLAAVREWKDLVRLSIAHFKFGAVSLFCELLLGALCPLFFAGFSLLGRFEHLCSIIYGVLFAG